MHPNPTVQGTFSTQSWIYPHGELKMADDLTKRGPPDGIRINVNEDWELRD
jgi:hypothetical protein